MVKIADHLLPHGLLSVPRRIIVTGGAGFIGSHLSQSLLEGRHRVIVIDSMLPYYDIRIKQRRVREMSRDFPDTFCFHQQSAGDVIFLENIFESERPEVVVHLGAQAGVRYCEEFKEEAQRNNIEATQAILNQALKSLCYQYKVLHFVFASSSSVYGLNERPWHEALTPRPEGFYATSKKIGEEICSSAAGRGIPIAALRFFTVYGPGGRPDMAPGKFLDLIHRRQPIPVFGDGSALRDFTFIDDIIQGIIRTIDRPRDYEVYNLGRGSGEPNSVLDLIRAIELNLFKKATINFLPPNPADVPATQADITKARNMLGYQPTFSLAEGIKANAEWLLRTIEKFVVAVVLPPPAAQHNATTGLENTLTSLLSQTSPPDLVLVFSCDGESDEKITVQGQTIIVHHRHHQKPLTPLIFRNLEILSNGNFDQLSWGKFLPEVTFLRGPSSVFVSFLHSGQTWSSPDLLQSVLEAISSSGSELNVWSRRSGVKKSLSPSSLVAVEAQPFIAEVCHNALLRLDLLLSSGALAYLSDQEERNLPMIFLGPLLTMALSLPETVRVSSLPHVFSCDH